MVDLERRREYSRKYRQSPKCALAERRWLDERGGRERRRENNRKYRQSIKGKHNGYLRAYLHRVYKNDPINNLTLDEWEKILEIYDYSCAYCGNKDNITLDHVIPVVRGGTHSKDNVVPACVSCNSSKKDRLPGEWPECPSDIFIKRTIPNMAVNKSILPVLSDDIIETARQLISTEHETRWILGDYLTDVVIEVAPIYKAAGVKYPRSELFRQIAGAIGVDPSTLRERQNMSEFFPLPIRQEYSALSWSQMRACKSAGDKWRGYADWALENLPAPCAAIRAAVKRNGHAPPAWMGRWERMYELACLLIDDPLTDARVRNLAGIVVQRGKYISIE